MSANFNSVARIPDFSFIEKANLNVSTIGIVSKVSVGSDKMILQSDQYKIEIPIKSNEGLINVYNTKDVSLKIYVIKNEDGSVPQLPACDEGAKFIASSSLKNSNLVELPKDSTVDYKNLENDNGTFASGDDMSGGDDDNQSLEQSLVA